MKHLFSLCFVFFCFIAHAEYNRGTVFFKDGSISKGLIKIKTEGGIKFKVNENAEIAEYDYHSIDGFDTEGKHYKYILVHDKEAPRLLNETLKGSITLYCDEMYNQNSNFPNAASVTSNMFIGGNNGAPCYFIKVNDDVIRIGIRIKKKHLKIFSSCESLMDKIENKELKKRNVRGIISYYNEHCW
ncbi:hypothetical protein [Mangrovimonas sp. TPBH4]|uniref:hypothetical protein n=1 Tax=Mangrovimonas sp. TPBH4 TaxID=1645914 RepID=UPI0006B6176F|nr:hypothetical protein [Mangrovimonas sp. TPBH4]